MKHIYLLLTLIAGACTYQSVLGAESKPADQAITQTVEHPGSLIFSRIGHNKTDTAIKLSEAELILMCEYLKESHYFSDKRKRNEMLEKNEIKEREVRKYLMEISSEKEDEILKKYLIDYNNEEARAAAALLGLLAMVFLCGKSK